MWQWGLHTDRKIGLLIEFNIISRESMCEIRLVCEKFSLERESEGGGEHREAKKESIILDIYRPKFELHRSTVVLTIIARH